MKKKVRDCFHACQYWHSSPGKISSVTDDSQSPHKWCTETTHEELETPLGIIPLQLFHKGMIQTMNNSKEVCSQSIKRRRPTICNNIIDQSIWTKFKPRVIFSKYKVQSLVVNEHQHLRKLNN